MPNVKISALPLFTGNTQGAEIVMNDSTGTTTYRVKKENFTTPSAGFSWVNGSPAYFNIAEAADQYIPFNTTIFNTNTDVFELVNSGSTAGTNADQGARIHFKQPGVYEITSNLHFFDLRAEMDVLVGVSSSATSNGSMSRITIVVDHKTNEAASADQMLNGTIMLNVTSAGYYNLFINVTDLAGNGPFPSDAPNNIAPSRIFVKKIS